MKLTEKKSCKKEVGKVVEWGKFNMDNLSTVDTTPPMQK
jgi:hypothetical protein